MAIVGAAALRAVSRCAGIPDRRTAAERARTIDFRPACVQQRIASGWAPGARTGAGLTRSAMAAALAASRSRPLSGTQAGQHRKVIVVGVGVVARGE